MLPHLPVGCGSWGLGKRNSRPRGARTSSWEMVDVSKPSFMVSFQGDLKKTCPAGIWLRSLIHYTFLADPWTDRVIGEPSEDNEAAFNTGCHIQKVRPAFFLPG